MSPRSKKSRLNSNVSESRRLEVLRSFEILDTPPEDEFDSIVRAAAYIADVPIALISLVDESRQWFKAKIGLDESETPRDVAFCDHAIRQSRPMLVPDARKDLRFTENPLVTGALNLRFYAGIPLFSSEGAGLGTLCVLDHRPRILSDEQVELLKGLAQHVEQALNIRRMSRLQREQQRELERAHALLESIAQNAPAMLFVKEAVNLEHTFWNKAAEELTGVPREQILGRTGFENFPTEQMMAFQERDRRALDEGVLVEAEETLTGPKGSRILLTKKVPIFDSDGRASFLLGISEDITLRKKSEENLIDAHQQLEERVQERTAEIYRVNEQLLQEMAEREQAQQALRESESRLRQSQKMEAIGRLAGGVAHDFNNLLMVILGYAQFLLADVGDDENLKESVEQIISAGRSAGELTSQLLAFGRRQVLNPQLLSLQNLVADLEKMLKRMIGADILLQTSFSPHLAKVEIDPGQFGQVIMNLAVNARDAMPAGGTLKIDVCDFDSARDGHDFPDLDQPGVLITVSDSGMGMNEATRQLIFEPFFTTKAVDKGTGLGLAIVLGIVEQSGGRIAVRSEEGRGTSFLIVLPQAEANSKPDSDMRRGMSVRPIPEFRGEETVLVVDDNPNVRTLVETILSRSGYQVLSAGSPGDALLVGEQYQRPIDLLLTDITMPQMNGVELSQRLLKIKPEMGILFMSGYAEVGHHTPLLQKPVTQESLLKTVRSVLETRTKNQTAYS